MPNAECNIALFIDLENFIGSATALGLPIDISKVIIKLKELGNVRIRKAYGDMQRALQAVGLGNRYYEIRRDFYANLIEVEDIPYLTPHKNTSDIKLVVESLSVGYQNEYITHFAVLASDRDYVPLYQKLRALNKTVITIGIDQMNMNSMVREASDRLSYYEHLFLGDAVGQLYESEEQNMALKNEYFALLMRSIKKLERENTEVSADALLESMRNARSDFDFALVGCKTFAHFLKLAEENHCIEQSADHLMRISGASVPHQQQVQDDMAEMEIKSKTSELATSDADAKREAKIYKKLLSDVLKIPFPELAERRTILEAINRALDREFGVSIKDVVNNNSYDYNNNKTFTFNDIADIVYEDMREDGFESNHSVIYKIVLGLHFARCFYEQRERVSDLTSIRVTGVAKPYYVWEDELYRNYIDQIRNNLQSRTPQNAGLAKLLYESIDDEALKRIQALRS
ncbi:MAG: NYN domain-containing protein [Synergistaceae bacterium]|nr:NYN domain-containing protein [Synergistaceae bacterium]